jgi:hypothetical protein
MSQATNANSTNPPAEKAAASTIDFRDIAKRLTVKGTVKSYGDDCNVGTILAWKLIEDMRKETVIRGGIYLGWIFLELGKLEAKPNQGRLLGFVGVFADIAVSAKNFIPQYREEKMCAEAREILGLPKLTKRGAKSRRAS